MTIETRFRPHEYFEAATLAAYPRWVEMHYQTDPAYRQMLLHKQEELRSIELEWLIRITWLSAHCNYEDIRNFRNQAQARISADLMTKAIDMKELMEALRNDKVRDAYETGTELIRSNAKELSRAIDVQVSMASGSPSYYAKPLVGMDARFKGLDHPLRDFAAEVVKRFGRFFELTYRNRVDAMYWNGAIN